MIPSYSRFFQPCKLDNTDAYATIIGREQRYKDFDMLISFIYNNNVAATLSEWEAQSGKIRIRTMIVVETDDPYLLEEIKNYKGMSAFSDGDLTTVLALTPNSNKKVKKLIEKNKRFCVLGS